MHPPETFHQQTPYGSVNVTVERHTVRAPAGMYVPYEGSDPLVRAAFPDGFSPSYGSGIAFIEKLADGALLFYCLTDRGPNGDGPQVPHPNGDGTVDTKIFPAPGFHPSIGIMHVDLHGATVTANLPIRVTSTMLASGLPLPPGADGAISEIPLHDSLRFDPAKAGFHAGGIDPESMAFDTRTGHLWIADEYGPYLQKIDPKSGQVLAKFGPGAGLPSILARRRANRGMEGMTYDASSGYLHAFLQSPISHGKQVERYARFLRWIEFDPAAGQTLRMLAYPLDPAQYKDGRTGHAKLGDLAALGGGRFVVIEQGKGSDGKNFNWLMLAEIADATEIPDTPDLEKSSVAGEAVNGADWSVIVPIKKTKLLDLNAIGWQPEKAEGIALVDAHTLAIINDNDFGMKTRAYDASGKEIEADVTEFEVNAEGTIVKGAQPDTVLRVARGDAQESELAIWLLRFEQPL